MKKMKEFNVWDGKRQFRAQGVGKFVVNFCGTLFKGLFRIGHFVLTMQLLLLK